MSVLFAFTVCKALCVCNKWKALNKYSLKFKLKVIDKEFLYLKLIRLQGLDQKIEKRRSRIWI